MSGIIENTEQPTKPTSEPQLKDPTQQQNKQAKPAKPKTITLKVEELVSWDNKIKALNNQVKQLNAENSSLKTELMNSRAQLANSSKRAEQRRAQDKQGLLQTIGELQKIIKQTNLNLSRLQKDSDRMRDELNIQRQGKQARQKQVDQLRNVSSEYFLLKQEVSRLEGQLTSLKKGRQNIKKTEEERAHLAEKVLQLEDSIKSHKQTILKYQQHNTQLVQQKRRSAQRINELKEQSQQHQKVKKDLESKIEILEGEIRQMENEKQVVVRRAQSELREVKQTLLKEVRLKDAIQQQLSKIKKNSQARGKRLAEMSEKDLHRKIQQLQTENTILKQTMERISNTLAPLEKQVKEKDASILVLTKQLAKTWPNLQDSQGLPYVEKDIIDIAKQQKENYGEIIQKVMIENLRLKYSIQTIGSEYNQELRKKK